MKLLSYKKIGKGKPLVLVHGYLGGQDMWKFQEELKDHFELIMPFTPWLWRECIYDCSFNYP